MPAPAQDSRQAPPGGRRSLTVGEDVYRRLEEFARGRGLSSPADAIPLLLDYADIHSRLDSLLQARIKELLQAGAGRAQARGPARRAGGGRTAWEILVEQRVICASTMRRARDPHRIIDVLKSNGALILNSGSDRCAVLPDEWASFIESLSRISTPDEREVLGKLKGEAKQLFKMLRAAGAVYYDSRTRTWVVDAGVIEREGEAPGPAETGGRRGAAGKYVAVTPKREVADVESYIAGMEREGYLCNERGDEVVCTWRELLEQAVADLNSAGTPDARDFERVLEADPVKLEASKAAYEAGLLWYDGKQRRWRIAS
jgi:hypothetical protein